MTISLMDAIKAVKNDEHWIRKIIIGGFIAILINLSNIIPRTQKIEILLILLVASILGLIATFLNLGFIVLSGNKMVNGDSYEMAEWNQSKIMNTAIITAVGVFIWLIIASIAVIIAGIAAYFIASFAAFVVYGILSIFSYSNPEVVRILTMVFGGALGIVIMLYFLQFMNAMNASYYKTLEIKSILSFGEHFNIIKNNFHASWSLIGKVILSILLFTLACVVASLTVIGIVLVPFIYFYGTMVSVALISQYAKQINIGQYL